MWCEQVAGHRKLLKVMEGLVMDQHLVSWSEEMSTEQFECNEQTATGCEQVAGHRRSWKVMEVHGRSWKVL